MFSVQDIRPITRAAFELGLTDEFCPDYPVPYIFGKNPLDDYFSIVSVIYALRMNIVYRLDEVLSSSNCQLIDELHTQDENSGHSIINSVNDILPKLRLHSALESYALDLYDDANNIFEMAKGLNNNSSRLYCGGLFRIEAWKSWLLWQSGRNDHFGYCVQNVLKIEDLRFPSLEHDESKKTVLEYFGDENVTKASYSAWKRLFVCLKTYGDRLLEQMEKVDAFNALGDNRTDSDYTNFSQQCIAFGENTHIARWWAVRFLEPKALLCHIGLPKALTDSAEWKLEVSKRLILKSKSLLSEAEELRKDAEYQLQERKNQEARQQFREPQEQLYWGATSPLSNNVSKNIEYPHSAVKNARPPNSGNIAAHQPTNYRSTLAKKSAFDPGYRRK